MAGEITPTLRQFAVRRLGQDLRPRRPHRAAPWRTRDSIPACLEPDPRAVPLGGRPTREARRRVERIVSSQRAPSKENCDEPDPDVPRLEEGADRERGRAPCLGPCGVRRVEGRPDRGPRQGGPPDRRALRGAQGRAGRHRHPRDGQAAERGRRARRSSAATSSTTSPTRARPWPRTSRSRRSPAARPSCRSSRSARCSASCRGTTPSTRSPGSRRRT